VQKEIFVSISVHEQVTLLIDHDTESTYTIAYQNLFTNIRFNWDEGKQPQHSMTFVSPIAYNGLATTVAFVAMVAAQNSIPTILVDADLHSPGLQQQFGTQVQQGLGELLATQTLTPQSLSHYLSKTSLPNLWLLGAGTAQYPPTEINRLLSTRLAPVIKALRQFLAETESQNGLVILHSPPLARGLDAMLISTLVDQTLLLIRRGQTKRSDALKAQQQLERAHARITGVIMVT
jgi:Mrp family chromosome partitioning ATPase